MKRLYDKNKLCFTLLWIAAYVLLFPLADKLSMAVGTRKIVTVPFAIVFTMLMLGFIVKNGLKEEYGLCRFKGNYKEFLYFIPLIPIIALYLWNGLRWESTTIEAVLCAVSMLFVGIIEELLFRGFLFRMICEDNIKTAVLVSSLTFGLGHIINLANGRELLSTLLQVCYASALGFLLTTLLYRGKSILPCAMIHGVLNIISIFNIPFTGMQRIISSAVLCVLSIAYTLWIWKKTDYKKEQENEQ